MNRWMDGQEAGMGVGLGGQMSGARPRLGAAGGKVSDEAELGRMRSRTHPLWREHHTAEQSR